MRRMGGRRTCWSEVVNTDKRCFAADPVTLEPEGFSVYDAYPLNDTEAHEVITVGVWDARRSSMKEKMIKTYDNQKYN